MPPPQSRESPRLTAAAAARGSRRAARAGSPPPPLQLQLAPTGAGPARLSHSPWPLRSREVRSDRRLPRKFQFSGLQKKRSAAAARTVAAPGTKPAPTRLVAPLRCALMRNPRQLKRACVLRWRPLLPFPPRTSRDAGALHLRTGVEENCVAAGSGLQAGTGEGENIT